MNIQSEFPVASKIKVLRNEKVIYEGIVACYPSYGKDNNIPAITIEQCNKQQLTFVFFQKLNGEEGWVLVPDPLPSGYALSQEAMLHNFEKN